MQLSTCDATRLMESMEDTPIAATLEDIYRQLAAGATTISPAAAWHVLQHLETVPDLPDSYRDLYLDVAGEAVAPAPLDTLGAHHFTMQPPGHLDRAALAA